MLLCWFCLGSFMRLHLGGGLARPKVQDGLTCISDSRLARLGSPLYGLSTPGKLDHHLHRVISGQLSKEATSRSYQRLRVQVWKLYNLTFITLFWQTKFLVQLDSNPLSRSESGQSHLIEKPLVWPSVKAIYHSLLSGRYNLCFSNMQNIFILSPNFPKSCLIAAFLSKSGISWSASGPDVNKLLKFNFSGVGTLDSESYELERVPNQVLFKLSF